MLHSVALNDRFSNHLAYRRSSTGEFSCIQSVEGDPLRGHDLSAPIRPHLCKLPLSKFSTFGHACMCSGGGVVREGGEKGDNNGAYKPIDEQLTGLLDITRSIIYAPSSALGRSTLQNSFVPRLPHQFIQSTSKTPQPCPTRPPTEPTSRRASCQK